MRSSWQGSEYPTPVSTQGALPDIFGHMLSVSTMPSASWSYELPCCHHFLFNNGCQLLWDDRNVLHSVTPCLSVDCTNAFENAFRRQSHPSSLLFCFPPFINRQTAISQFTRSAFLYVKYANEIIRLWLNVSIKLAFLGKSHFCAWKAEVGGKLSLNGRHWQKNWCAENTDMVLLRRPHQSPARQEADRNRKQEHSGDKWQTSMMGNLTRSDWTVRSSPCWCHGAGSTRPACSCSALFCYLMLIAQNCCNYNLIWIYLSLH